MNPLTDKALSAAHLDGWMMIHMQSGMDIRFPVAEDPRLAAGTHQQLSHIEISPFGLHWPHLDENLSFKGLLEGNHGQFQKMAKS